MKRNSVFAGRRGALLAILILAALAVVATRLDPLPPAVSGPARASDGDSFRLGDDRIRLLGLDAPELAQRCDAQAGGQWPCGQEARRRLAILLSGGTVHCQPEGTDRYGRLLARCTVAGADIAQVLVAEGLAVSTGDYWREEAAAIRNGIGIWQGDFERPDDWRDDHPRGQGLLGLGLGWL